MNKEKLDALLNSGSITQEEYNDLLKKLETDKPAPQETTKQEPENGGGIDEEALERLIQAKVDKITSKIGKEKAELQKKLEVLKKEKLTDAELKKMELSEKEQEIAERERALNEKENRLYAIKAIKAAGLDDGSDKSLELVEFVLCDDTDQIDERVKAFGNLVKKYAKAEIDKAFKENGRTPNGGVKAKAENNPFAENGFNLSDQMRMMIENPELAKALESAAKVKQ